MAVCISDVNESKPSGRRDMISDMCPEKEEDVMVAGKINGKRDRE